MTQPHFSGTNHETSVPSPLLRFTPILMPDGFAEYALVRALISLADEVSGFNQPLINRISDEEGRYSAERMRTFVEDLLAGGSFSSDYERDFYQAFFYCEIRMRTTDWIATENYFEGLDPWIPDPATATLMDVTEDALRAQYSSGVLTNTPNFCVRDYDYLRQLYVALGEESAYESLATLTLPRRHDNHNKHRDNDGASVQIGSYIDDLNAAYEQIEVEMNSMSRNELIAAGLIDPDAEQIRARYESDTTPSGAGGETDDTNDAPWNHPDQLNYVRNLYAIHERQSETLRYTMPDASGYIHHYQVLEQFLPRFFNPGQIEKHVLKMSMDYLRRNPTPIRQTTEDLLNLVRDIEEITARLRDSNNAK